MAKLLLPVKHLSQRDNDSETLYGKRVGPANECAPTSMAIVAHSFGFKGEGMRPQLEDEISYKLWTKYGQRTSGTLACMKALMEKEYGLQNRIFFEADTNVNNIKKALSEGKLIIAHTWLTGSGHVIVICGFDDSAYGDKGAFICCDPWGEWDATGYRFGVNKATGKQYGDHVLYSYRLASSKFAWHHQIGNPQKPLAPVDSASGKIEEKETGTIHKDFGLGLPLKQGKLQDFFKFYDETNLYHGEAIVLLEGALALKAKGFCGNTAEWILRFRGQTKEEAEPGYIKDGKLRNFFKYYNENLPNHKQAVVALEEKIRMDAPDLLLSSAPWIALYRSAKPKASAFSLSPYGFKVLEHFEGCHKKIGEDKYTSYPDAGYGWNVATIGIGSTRYEDGSKVKQGDVISRNRAWDLVRHEIERIIVPVLKKIPVWEKLNKDQKEALIIFSFNLGPHWYQAKNFSTITSLVNASPDRWTDEAFVLACFTPYSNSNGKRLEGLVRRRKAEAALFLGRKPL
jgi:GH24 family phage-related lysozyme (muramidase)